jgi:hypothetical protein
MSDLENPSWRVFADGPKASREETPCWWTYGWNMSKEQWELEQIKAGKMREEDSDPFDWCGCPKGCCRAESHQLTVIDHPRNDPEGVEIIRLAREGKSINPESK